MLALAIALSMTGQSASAVSAIQDATDATNQPLDLAAMALTLDDLGAEGLDGYRIRSSELYGNELLAQRIANEIDRPENDVLADLEAAGVLRNYAIALDLAEQPDDPASVTTDRVLVYLSEATDSEGAEALFELREGNDDVGDAADVSDAASLGDQSELTRFTADTEDGYDHPVAALDFALRVDRVYADIVVMSFDTEGNGFEAPEQATAEALGERLLERVRDGLAGNAPGLSTLVVRLDSIEGTPVVPFLDHYEVTSGTLQPFVGMIDESVNALREEIGTFGIEDRYRLEQVVQTDPEGPAAVDNPFVVVHLARFADDRGAAEWVEGAAERLDALSYFSDVEEVAEADVLGDSSIAARYSVDYDEQTTVDGYAFFVQFGDFAFGIEVDNGSLAAVTELAGAQLACLEDSACSNAILVPDALLNGSKE
jgi:hypothetical protein